MRASTALPYKEAVENRASRAGSSWRCMTSAACAQTRPCATVIAVPAVAWRQNACRASPSDDATGPTPREREHEHERRQRNPRVPDTERECRERPHPRPLALQRHVAVALERAHQRGHAPYRDEAAPTHDGTSVRPRTVWGGSAQRERAPRFGQGLGHCSNVADRPLARVGKPSRRRGLDDQSGGAIPGRRAAAITSSAYSEGSATVCT